MPRYAHAARRPNLTALLLCAALATILYSPAILHGAFIRDDWFNFEAKPAGHLAKVWVGDWMEGDRHASKFYRPISRLSMQLDAWLFAPKSPGKGNERSWEEVERLARREGLAGWESPFFLCNALIHGVNVWLVWVLLGFFGLQGWPRRLGAAVFLIYPTHPGAVYWLSGRTDLLVTLWTLVTLIAALAWAEDERRWWLFLPAAFLAFGSKESSLALPFLVPLCLAARVPRPSGRAILRSSAAMMGLTFAYLLLRLGLFGGIGGYYSYDLMQMAELAAGYQRVLGGLLLPLREGLGQGLTLIAAAAVVAAFVPRARLLYLGLAWLVAAVLPLAGLHATIAEGARYFYLPSVGLAFIVGDLTARMAASRAWGGAPAGGRRVALRGLALGLLSAYGFALFMLLLLNMAAWNVGSSYVRETLRLTARAFGGIPAGSDLVPLNETRQHYTSYVQDYWSLRRALDFLRGGATERLRRFVPSEADETEFAPYAIVFRDETTPYGFTVNQALGRQAERHGEALLGRIDGGESLDLADPENFRWLGHGALFLRGESGEWEAASSSLDPPELGLIESIVNHRFGEAETAALIFAGPIGATLSARPGALRDLSGGVEENPTAYTIEANVLSESPTWLEAVVRDREEGPWREWTRPVQTLRFEQVGREGPLFARQSFAAGPLAEFDLRFPAPGGWFRVREIGLTRFNLADRRLLRLSPAEGSD